MQSPTPANPDRVQQQLAIFDVVRRARGKTLAEVKTMLTKAFAERGLPRQPALWLDAVASEAAYGKPYIVDLPAAVAADSITSAPDPKVEEILRDRRQLRSESDTEGGETGSATNVAEVKASDDDAVHHRGAAGVPPLTLLGFVAAAAAIALAAAAARAALRRSNGASARPHPFTTVAVEGRQGAHRRPWVLFPAGTNPTIATAAIVDAPRPR